MRVRRSKTDAGHRTILLNRDATLALAKLRERAEAFGSTAPEQCVFPACENKQVDPCTPQKSWRSAWRRLTKAAGFPGFRFHDLRHQAITEMAEVGASDATIMAVAGHVDRAMMEHYSHVRMAAKRDVLQKLESGLMEIPMAEDVATKTPGRSEKGVASQSASQNRFSWEFDASK
ncbi:MAG: tyrosine-type recombinase/integrase [Bryobacteraceae bacterium]